MSQQEIARRTWPLHVEIGGGLRPAVCNWKPEDTSNECARRDLVKSIRRLASRSRAEWWRELTGADDCGNCQECDEDSARDCECCEAGNHTPDFGYDTRAVVGFDGSILGVQVMLAGGGPSIWLDTQEHRVTGYGFGDVVYAELDRPICDLVTEHVARGFEGQEISGF